MIDVRDIDAESHGIDCSGALGGYTEVQERENVRLAKWSILHDGKLLPVTNLYDSEGEATDDWILADRAVAFDADRADGNWITISGLEPYDIWKRPHAEVSPEHQA
jgi:hypothetical protein